MASKIPANDSEDKEEDGRILDDREYAQALNKRDDIFLVEKENRLRAVEAVALMIGAVFGLWLSTTQSLKISHEFYQTNIQQRIAHLRRGPDVASLHVKALQEALRVERSNEAMSETYSGAPQKSFSVKEYDRTKSRKVITVQQVNEQATKSGATTGAGQDHTPAGRDDTNNAEEETKLINLGNANKLRGNRADAFSAFRQVLKQNPHDARALAGLGDLFLYTGYLDSAAAFYTAANSENPKSAAVHTGLGTVRYYLSIMAANPNFAAQRKISDPRWYVESQYDSALAEYTSALSLDSASVDALTNRGVLRDLHGSHTEAIKDYTRAIHIKPTYAEAYAKRAGTYKALGKFNDAIADYSVAINLDSGSYQFDPTLHFANAYFGRGNVYYQAGNYQKAIADYDSTLALNPYHSLAMVNKARALSDARQFDSAIVWYTRAITVLSPKEYGGALERALFGRGVAYDLTNQPALALKDFNDALKMKPGDRYARFHRGNAYKALAKYAEAIADYAFALGSPALAAKASSRIAECKELAKQP